MTNLDLTIWFSIFVSTYLIGVGYIAWRANVRSRSICDFEIAGRKVGAFTSAISLTAGARDGAGIAAWVAFTFYFGFGALWLYVGVLLALILVLFTKQGFREYCAERNYVSITEFIRDSYGRTIEKVVVALYSLTGVLIVAAQLFVAGQVLSSMIMLPAEISVISVSLIVILYLISGGYFSVTWTDGFQWFVFLVILIFIFLLPNPIESIKPLEQMSNVPFETATPLILLVAAIFYSGGDLWQRIIATKSDHTATKSIYLAAIAYGVISVLVILMAFSIKSIFPETDPSTAFMNVFNYEFGWTFVGPMLAMFIIAAIMSTVDTQIFLIASSITAALKGDRVPPTPSKPLMNRLIIGISIFATAIALMIGDIVLFLFSSYSLGGIIAPLIAMALIFGLRRIPSNKIILLGIFFAVVSYIVIFFVNKSGNLNLNLIPIAISTCFAIIAWFLSKNRVIE